ncbi:MAG: PEP/pyruvate-binding domain-containing protein [Anaerolineaceae bacterium]|nr:PEP/pyruvate-binding domain-containing protein [Anaerolineaceae bacterium]
MVLPVSRSSRFLSVYMAIVQYPMLAGRIRQLMRAKMAEKGIISIQALNNEAIQSAIQSQEREGLHDPLFQESAENWERRKSLVIDSLTDAYFSENFDYEALTAIIQQSLSERGVLTEDLSLDFNPEFAPTELLFNRGIYLEGLSAEEVAPHAARLAEIKVVLIRKMISDQLRYVNIAKDWFTVQDLAEIRRHKLGEGRIGGKAAGMLLAARILKEKASDALKTALRTPTSYYIGSDVFYNFMSVNNLIHWSDQKYKTEKQMWEDYPRILEDFGAGTFPPTILQYLETIIAMTGGKPLIVRSSSLLEDNFGTAFAGKYESIFLPNQGIPEDNLRALMLAMAQIYASALHPSALVYRKNRGLQDYDEQMALLIQVVEGQEHGTYYFPELAGVGFSHNTYRWSPQIRAQDGFLRLVWGLGTRSVDRVGNDYPRLIALSHPTLNPSSNQKSILRYAQQYIDLINLEKNVMETLPVHEVLSSKTPHLRYLAQVNSEGYIHSLYSNLIDGSPSDLVLTFEDLLAKTKFPNLMREMLMTLEAEYRTPVDLEFTACLEDQPGGVQPFITLIQCRPLTTIKEGISVIPKDVALEDILFSASTLVAGGTIEPIEYILSVSAEKYFSLKTQKERYALERTIGRLNATLDKETFICIGPGRWGTSNTDLGIHVDYADIFNTSALVEVAGSLHGVSTEPSLGTHFFQDLMEGQIYPLGIKSGEDHFDQARLDNAPNHLLEWIDADPEIAEVLRLVKAKELSPNGTLSLAMDDRSGKALCYFTSK